MYANVSMFKRESGRSVTTMNIKVIALVFALLVLTPLATAQCPVKVTKIENSNPLDKILVVEYENTSHKDIHAVKFSAVFFDAVGDPHSAVYDYTSEKKLKPGKKYTDFWDINLYAGYRTSLQLKKVMFEDGSTWQASQDTMPQTCEWEVRRK
jgi:hypothetical protein